jgi:hypothetical protein
LTVTDPEGEPEKEMAMAKKSISKSRREVVKKAAYVVPAVLTLAAAPSFAQSGSGRRAKPRRKPGPDR